MNVKFLERIPGTGKRSNPKDVRSHRTGFQRVRHSPNNLRLKILDGIGISENDLTSFRRSQSSDLAMAHG